METKEIHFKNTLKANIISFLSYGIFVGFIFALIAIFIKYAIHNIPNTALSFTLSLMAGIIIFYLLHFICKSSTIETFKKAKISNEYSKEFLKKMNLLFMICIILSIIVCVGYLVINNFIFSTAITQAYEKYSTISPELTNKIINNINEEYKITISGRLISSIVIELSLVISFLSLIPYQAKILEKYNKSTD